MGDEKLAAVSVGSGICHRKYAGFMFQRIACSFIFEFITGAAAATSGRIAALNHEITDHAMEFDAVIKSLAGEEYKVIHRLGSMLSIQFNLDQAAVGLHGEFVGFLGINFHCRGLFPLHRYILSCRVKNYLSNVFNTAINNCRKIGGYVALRATYPPILRISLSRRRMSFIDTLVIISSRSGLSGSHMEQHFTRQTRIIQSAVAVGGLQAALGAGIFQTLPTI